MTTITGPLSRRGVLGRAAAGGALLLPSALPGAAAAAPEAVAEPIAPDGPSGPFPIPWLDANGNHNQPAGPDLEPSHVYHFKGRVARCSGFDGAGIDGAGERLLFGTKTTDYGIMDGVYWAARKPQPAALTHI